MNCRVIEGFVRTALVLLVLLGSGCATVRNPFRDGEGPIRIEIVNRSLNAAEVTVLGQEEPIQLGMITGNQRRTVELNWEGDYGQISVRLQRPGGGRLHETFPIRVEPGDRFLLELPEDLSDAELVRL